MEKIKIEREIDVDTDRLFSNISSAIEYLQEIKDEYGDIDLITKDLIIQLIKWHEQ